MIMISKQRDLFELIKKKQLVLVYLLELNKQKNLDITLLQYFSDNIANIVEKIISDLLAPAAHQKR